MADYFSSEQIFYLGLDLPLCFIVEAEETVVNLEQYRFFSFGEGSNWSLKMEESCRSEVKIFLHKQQYGAVLIIEKKI